MDREAGPLGPLLDRVRAQVEVRVVAEAVEDDARAGGSEDVPHVRVVPAGDDPPPGRYEGDAGAEGRLHGVEIRVEVGVVELHRSEDERLGSVVKELRALVLPGGGVLVPLDDEGGPRTGGRGGREVPRLARDEVAGRLPGRGEEPRRQRGRRRLAVGPGDDDRVPPCEELRPEGLRHRSDRQPERKGGDELGVVLSREVPDDDLVDARGRFRASNPGRTSIPRAARRSDIGG